MKSIDNSLKNVYRQLIAGNLGLAITEMEVYLTAWPQPQTSERLLDIKSGYLLMVDYWRNGIKDLQRQELFGKLLQKLYVLFANVAIYRRVQTSSFLSGIYSQARQSQRDWSVASIRNEMENFVSEVALLEFEKEDKRATKKQELYKIHYQKMNALFNYVLTTRMWSDSVGRDFLDLLLSPTVDSIDQQLLTTGIMLSLMNQFDLVKFRLLVEVYSHSQDEQVRQRALVGWVFGVDDDMDIIYPEQRKLIREMCNMEQVCSELTELQMQLVYTINAEKDNDTLQKEIMPDLVKNHFRITRDGIQENEDDPLEEVLNPDASEQRMEQLEALIQRMDKLQKQGSDIYFGGFSQMKRYPFFYDISNWLIPFFLEHPDLAQYVNNIEEVGFVETILKRGMFCNSDKYSFVVVANQIFSQLPENFRLMIQQHEISQMELPAEEEQTPTFLRRIFLMDLYRFFKLFPNRSSFNNPFDSKLINSDVTNFFSHFVFWGTPLDAHKHSVVRIMKKLHYDKMAENVLDSIPMNLHDVQYYLWKGDYDSALRLEQDNERALSGKARACFKASLYIDANECYDRLLLLYPGNKNYMLNKAVCLVRMEEYEDALKLLYHLDYEYSDEPNIQRVLAWTLTCDGKTEQAERIFLLIKESSCQTSEDALNYGYCLWLMNRVDDAVASFKQYIALEPDHLNSFPDEHWLLERGITFVEIQMMKALVLS